MSKINSPYGGDNMSKLKGFIFDMDGVVVDNYPYHFQAWMEFASKYNFPLDAKVYRDKFNGKTNADLFQMIFGDHLTQEQINGYAQEKESNYQKLYEKEIKPLAGLVEFLDFLKAQNLKIALGTSAPTQNVDFTLDKLSLRHYFDVIIDGPQVTKGKPDPEVYLKCASGLGLDPKECVVFEDSLAGLESGKRAGCDIVAVATSHEAHELENQTSIIIHDFTQVKKLLAL